MTKCSTKGCTSMSDREKASAGGGKDGAERTEEQKLHKLTLLAKETQEKDSIYVLSQF